MAVAVDASSPVRTNGAASTTTPVTSASFTAPANALLVCCISCDGSSADGGGGTLLTATPSDTGTLTWTKQVERTWIETTDGAQSAIWTARTTSAVSRTVSVTRQSAGSGVVRRTSFKVYVLTGVDVDGTPVDTVGASNEGGSATNNLTTTSVTPGASGLLVVCDTDWNAAGNLASSDLTVDTTTFATEISVCSGYKTCTAGVGVTGNLDAGGAGAVQHKWCQIVVRAAAVFIAAAFKPICQAVQRASYR